MQRAMDEDESHRQQSAVQLEAMAAAVAHVKDERSLQKRVSRLFTRPRSSSDDTARSGIQDAHDPWPADMPKRRRSQRTASLSIAPMAASTPPPKRDRRSRALSSRPRMSPRPSAAARQSVSRNMTKALSDAKLARALLATPMEEVHDVADHWQQTSPNFASIARTPLRDCSKSIAAARSLLAQTHAHLKKKEPTKNVEADEEGKHDDTTHRAVGAALSSSTTTADARALGEMTMRSRVSLFLRNGDDAPLTPRSNLRQKRDEILEMLQEKKEADALRAVRRREVLEAKIAAGKAGRKSVANAIVAAAEVDMQRQREKRAQGAAKMLVDSRRNAPINERIDEAAEATAADLTCDDASDEQDDDTVGDASKEQFVADAADARVLSRWPNGSPKAIALRESIGEGAFVRTVQTKIHSVPASKSNAASQPPQRARRMLHVDALRTPSTAAHHHEPRRAHTHATETPITVAASSSSSSSRAIGARATPLPRTSLPSMGGMGIISARRQSRRAPHVPRTMEQPLPQPSRAARSPRPRRKTPAVSRSPLHRSAAAPAAAAAPHSLSLRIRAEPSPRDEVLRALASKVADVAEYQQNALRELWNDGAEGERAEPDVVANAVVAKMLRALGKSFVSEEEQLAVGGEEGSAGGDGDNDEEVSAVEALRLLLVERVQMAAAYDELSRRYDALLSSSSS